MDDALFAKLQELTLVNKSGVTYQEFRRMLTPHWRLVWAQIALGWVMLIVSSVLIFFLSGRHAVADVALIVGGAMLIGYNVAYLQLFLHEAAHYNLHPDRKINDLLCNIFVSGIVGQEIKNYRPIHWDHHRYLGTLRDTEITYFDPLDIKFLLEALFGIRALKVIFVRHHKRRAEQEDREASALVKIKPYTLIGGFCFNLAYVLLLLYFRQWPLVLAWTAGILVFFPFFGALRQMLEHRNEYADRTVDYAVVAHGAIHRLFGDGLIAITFGGVGFNRHLLHHWEPQISYTRLHELEDYLMNTDSAVYLRECRTTYGQTFWRMFHPVWK